MISLLCSRMMLAAFLLVLMQAVYASPAKGQLTAFAENDRYSLSVRAADGAVVVALRDGTVRAFTPDFKVLYAEKDPQLAKKPAGYEKVNYVVPTWFVGEGVTDGGLRTLDTTVVGGEGLAAGSEAGDIEGRTADL
ncbi:MAG: hypothetical protein AB8C95_05015 [Phycisphaeraceae bacterium]